MRMPRVSGRFRFGGKVFDGLRLGVLEDLEVIFGLIGNEGAVLVFDVKEESDYINVDLQGFVGLLDRLLSVAGIRRSRGLSHSRRGDP